MAKTNVWMSVSDLMTGLMMIFLFIAIAYMSRVTHDIKQYADTKHVLYDSLSKISEVFDDGSLAVDSDLTLRFVNATTLFERGESTPTPEFAHKLDVVMPHYLDILIGLDKSLKDNIKEIRIEGHTDTLGYTTKGLNPYRENLKLSQNRAREVLFHILDIVATSDYAIEDKKLLEHLLTANGYSYSMALDKNGDFIYDSHLPMDTVKSRRVEIKIITNEKAVIEKLIKKE